MFDMILISMLAAADVLTTIYWACGIFGMGLLLVSVIGGHHDTDADVSGVDFHGDMDVDFHGDVDVDFHGDVVPDIHVDADVDVAPDLDVDVDAAHGAAGHEVMDGVGHVETIASDASSLSSWLSIRFVVFFLASFGAVGVVLTTLTSAGSTMTFIVSFVTAVVLGQGVHHIFRKVQKASGNSTPGIADYVHQIGRVTIPVTHSQKGEIAISVRGGQRYVPATSSHPDAAFNAGDEVAVVDYSGGIAEVISRKEYEFLNSTKKGGKP